MDIANEGIIKAVVLFGLSKRKNNRTNVSRAIDFALLNAKARIASKLTSTEFLSPQDLRGIIITATARYGALTLKIPSVTNNSWTLASREIYYFPPSLSAILK
ncbi:Uncharacterized protein FKW44_004263 [Caligus rogercresseyi]|uniref:Uncharacterized protein n=1 Tax=Caligus rogercresseyi TaxID=217165 RepID=A0A7T8HLD2_CALRO|nr:Uncharacterized protein FKW44_004263 [Caligus rogercresseyi]